jgi:hypothetical protein
MKAVVLKGFGGPDAALPRAAVRNGVALAARPRNLHKSCRSTAHQKLTFSSM